MKILFICTGNTCRSPMALGLFRKKCREHQADSCGISAFSGDSAAENSIEAMKKYGVDLKKHRARPFNSYMSGEYDLFVVMTREQKHFLERYVPRERIIILGGGIPDPYGGDTEEYMSCAEEIDKALDSLIAALTSQTEISPMTGEDIKEIALIEKECFSTPWSEESLSSELTNDSAEFFKAKCGGKITGYMGMHIVLDECYIANIAVRPCSRRQGTATKLLDKAEEKAKNRGCSFISLEVRCSNEAAIGLYKKRGYVSQGIRKGFYSQPSEDALIMTKTFSEEG